MRQEKQIGGLFSARIRELTVDDVDLSTRRTRWNKLWIYLMAVWYIFFRVLFIVLGRSHAHKNVSHVKVEGERQQDKCVLAFFIVRKGDSGSRAQIATCRRKENE